MPKVYSDQDELYAEWLYTFLRHDEVMAEYEYFPSPTPIGLPSPCSEVATSPTPPPMPVLPPTRSPGRRDFEIAAVMFHRTADDLGWVNYLGRLTVDTSGRRWARSTSSPSCLSLSRGCMSSSGSVAPSPCFWAS